MARSLEEILADLNAAEKEYSEKCKKYGIEEKHRKKKEEPAVDENGNPIAVEEESKNQEVQETVQNTSEVNVEQGQ